MHLLFRTIIVSTFIAFVAPQMLHAAVAFDAASESHTTGTTGASATFSWAHTPSGTPRGVLVFVFNRNDPSGNDTSGVTYGGVDVPLVTGGVARDTTASTEGGSTQAYFLGSSVPAGAQTVEVTESGTYTNAYAIAITVTASTDTEYTGVFIEEQNQALTEENVDDGSLTGTDSVRFAGVLHGGNNDGPAGANSTSLHNIDFGAFNNSAYRETNAGQGSRPVGVENATADDVAAVYLAIREVPGPAEIPTVETGVAGSISSSGATLFGKIASVGGAAITQHGFATSTDPTFPIANSATTTLGTGTLGEFSGAVSGLVADTFYYYRAYAVNSAGVGYGVVRSFFTGNTTPTRTMRLFAGYSVRFYSGKIMLHQQTL